MCKICFPSIHLLRYPWLNIKNEAQENRNSFISWGQENSAKPMVILLPIPQIKLLS